MFVKYIFIVFVISLGIHHSVAEKMAYMECQHATAVYNDQNYLNVKLSTRRYSRKNPLYFFTAIFNVTRYIDNSYKLHFYFYELLSNVYKRSFVEFYHNYCDALKEDILFGQALKSVRNYSQIWTCPLAPGPHVLGNVTPPYGNYLTALPFKQGRLFINITNPNEKIIFTGYVDLQVKEMDAVKFYKYKNSV